MVQIIIVIIILFTNFINLYYYFIIKSHTWKIKEMIENEFLEETGKNVLIIPMIKILRRRKS